MYNNINIACYRIWSEVSESIVKGDLSTADSIKKKVEAAARAKRNQYSTEKDFPRKYFGFNAELQFWELNREHSPAVTHRINHKTHHDKHQYDEHLSKKKKIQRESIESSEGATVSVNN